MTTIRYYILPMERTTIPPAHGPKYFAWLFDPDPPGLADVWKPIDYGLIDVTLICADISDASHAVLAAAGDVLVIPLVIDNNFTTAAVETAQTWCETHGIPAHWITTSLTYRQALRVISGLFLYVQRVTAILESPITLTGGVLDVQMKNIVLSVRNAMAQAASEAGYDYAWITGSTTVRQVLVSMAQSWGTQPIYFGIATL